MTDSTVNWKLKQRNCVKLNVETDLCEDGETTGQFFRNYLRNSKKLRPCLLRNTSRIFVKLIKFRLAMDCCWGRF